MSQKFDSVVVGAGIVGLALARELHSRYPNQKIAVFDKEPELGAHASGRNSGVLHSGIYYPSDSLKARVCADGRKEMVAFCEENRLPMMKTGKVILPVQDGDDRQLELLLERAPRNGVKAELIDHKQLSELEPAARSRTGKALFVPDACLVEPKLILQKLKANLEQSGVTIGLEQRITGANPGESSIHLEKETIHYGHLFNAAGAYADRVAQLFGAAKNYTILPFKGIYYRLSPSSGITIRHLIYAVPDPRVPFLGVHYMKNFHDEIYLGPTVIPAFGRENYTLFSGLNLFDTSTILFRIAQQYFNNHQGFRALVHREGKRFLRPYFAEAVQRLTPGVRPSHLVASDKVGIRAQLMDLNKKELVMDFLVERTKNETHILNAVSPAFTSSFAFAKFVLSQSQGVPGISQA